MNMKFLFKPECSILKFLWALELLLPGFAYTQSEKPPSWTSHAIWYQIMVERFYNGDKNNDPKRDDIRTDTSYIVPADWKMSDWTTDWYGLSDYEKNLSEKQHKNFNSIVQLRRYGGDIQGILDKLNYLTDLGITAVYLNPVNDAPSLHKYDARNYHHIDVNFGPDPQGDKRLIASEKPGDPASWKWTSADRLFLKLVEELHKRHIRIIIDYSWNHTGTEFWAWRDLVKNQTRSPYKDWYMIESFDDPATPAWEFRYKGWLNVKSMPEIKKVNVTGLRINGYPYQGDINAGAKQHIMAVTRRWLAPDGDTSKGVDGFRLDVADQIPMGFWRDYNQFVKSIKPDAYLVGEIWWAKWPDLLMDPKPYVNDSIFDAVMHYQVYRPARCFFGKVNDSINAEQFRDSLVYHWSRIPRIYQTGMMNVSSTHDSPRLLTCFYNPGKYKYNATPGADPEYKTGRPDAETYRRSWLYLVHQFTAVGAPQIWNGEEMGMWGSDDPDCRKPLWWKEYQFQAESRYNINPKKTGRDIVEFDANRYQLYQRLIRLRKENSALQTDSIEFLYAKGKLLAYRRADAHENLIIVFNAGNYPAEVNLNQSGLFIDLLEGKEFHTLQLRLEPLSCLILRKI